jgi:hypothetical protein
MTLFVFKIYAPEVPDHTLVKSLYDQVFPFCALADQEIIAIGFIVTSSGVTPEGNRGTVTTIRVSPS